MKIVLLIAVMCPAIVLAMGRNDRPCQEHEYNEDPYKAFCRRHIISDSFITSDQHWKEHLEKLNRCKVPFQTFIKEKHLEEVEQICNGKGKNSQRNLCTSTARISVYNLQVNTNDCSIINNPTAVLQYVTVACDKVGNSCRPVHFERSNNEKPKDGNVCKP